MCHFGNGQFTKDSLYQICSCGEHVWSTRAKKIMALHSQNHVQLSDVRGNRYLHYIGKRKASSFLTWATNVLLFVISFVWCIIVSYFLFHVLLIALNVKF
jgi:hypothetical protein